MLTFSLQKKIKTLTVISTTIRAATATVTVTARRYEKPPLAARCCHVANDLTNFTGDRLTKERTDKQTNRRTSPLRKAPNLRAMA